MHHHIIEKLCRIKQIQTRQFRIWFSILNRNGKTWKQWWIFFSTFRKHAKLWKSCETIHEIFFIIFFEQRCKVVWNSQKIFYKTFIKTREFYKIYTFLWFLNINQFDIILIRIELIFILFRLMINFKKKTFWWREIRIFLLWRTFYVL